MRAASRSLSPPGGRRGDMAFSPRGRPGGRSREREPAHFRLGRLPGAFVLVILQRDASSPMAATVL